MYITIDELVYIACEYDVDIILDAYFKPVALVDIINE